MLRRRLCDSSGGGVRGDVGLTVVEDRRCWMYSCALADGLEGVVGTEEERV